MEKLNRKNPFHDYGGDGTRNSEMICNDTLDFDIEGGSFDSSWGL